MFSAIILFTKGWGNEQTVVKANSYAELTEKVDNLVERIQGTRVVMLGVTTIYKVEKVTYNYPSGKKFVKKF